MEDRYAFLVFGTVLIGFGLLTILSQETHIGMPFYDPSFDVDLTSIKWIAGLFFILWGSYVLFKTIKSKPYKDYNLKCTKCGGVFIINNLEDLQCEKCGGHLEGLEGFFERHPEFKENNIPTRME